MKSLRDFLGKKKPTPTAPKHDPLDDLDSHVDEIHHHLKKLHGLTHPAGKFRKSVKASGGDVDKYHDIHKNVSSLLKHFD